MLIKTHLKGAFGFNGFLYLAFLLIEDIWHDFQKGSESILGSIYFQTFAVSPAINNLVYPCPNLWCNNSKATLFPGVTFFDLVFYFGFTKKVCFLCSLCGRVTAFFSCHLSTPCKTLCEINKYVPN